MKYLIFSDIHGNPLRLRKVLDFFHRQQYDMLCILGDIMNYGPRNGVTPELNAPAVAELLNPLADRIVAIRGNCDAEVDQMLLHFPMMADYAYLVDNGIRLFLTHGHVYNPEKQPTLPCDIFCYGHTHLAGINPVEEDSTDRRHARYICNTGSITFPKGGNPPTFVTLADGILSLRLLDDEGTVITEVRVTD